MSDVLRHLEDGDRALARGDFGHAVTAFTAARIVAPYESALALMLANAHRLNGDLVGARTTLMHEFDRAVLYATKRSSTAGDVTAHTQAITAARQIPLDANAWHALGSALLETGASIQAADCFARVMRTHPNDPAAIAALASAKCAMGQPGAAWPLVKRALDLAPRHPAYLLTAAQIRHELGDLTGATLWLEQAMSVRPEHGPTRLQRAYTTMLSGASARGWAYFESRALPTPATSARAWHGEPLAGQSIVVTAEQGVGDQFQFIRFIPMLAALNPSRVVVECHADAVSLLRANGIDAVPRGQPPVTDWHVPLLSLPHRLHLDAQLYGNRVPYLRAPQLSAHEVALPMAISGHRRLGLVWAGNPAFSGRVTRDLDAALLPDLLAMRDVSWVSLQFGVNDTQPATGLHYLPAPADWSATARVLSQLDGLVTTDTGIAHLAGAMGIETWVLLQHVPDWRWGLSGARTPWYPTHHLLRQTRSGDWKGVVAQLHAALGAIPNSVSVASTTRVDAPGTP